MGDLPKLYKGRSMRIGLGLLALALMLIFAMGVVSIDLSQVMGAYLLTVALLGASGFGLLVLSTFLPRDKREKPTFTQELLSREKLQYGVFTDGNWRSVLDEKDEKTKDKEKRRYQR